MKKKYNFILLILLFFSLFSFIYAESNGIWSYASDIRGGIFGLDEEDFLSSYVFINPVILNSNFSILGYISSDSPILDNHSVNKEYLDSNLGNIISNSSICAKEGKIFDGNNCIYAKGVDVIPDSFSFNDVSGAEFNSDVFSNEVIFSGFDVSLNLEIISSDTDSSIIKNDIDVGSSTIVVSGDRVKLRMKSLDDYELISSLNYQLEGNSLESWSVTTKKDELFIEEVDYQAFGTIRSGYIDTDHPQGWSLSRTFQRDISGVSYLEAEPFFYISNTYMYFNTYFRVRYRTNTNGVWTSWSSYIDAGPGNYGGKWYTSATRHQKVVFFNREEQYPDSTIIEIQYYSNGDISGRSDSYRLGGGYYKTINWLQR